MGQAILAILVAALVAVGLYSYVNAHGLVATTATPAAVATAQIASQPLGTGGFILPGASGSPPVPQQQQTTIVTSIGNGAEELGLALTPTTVTEDSRCPIDVTCVQAGTVRVETRIGDNWTGSLYVFSLGVPVQIKQWVVELIEVSPARVHGGTIDPSQYRLTYHITDTGEPSS